MNDHRTAQEIRLDERDAFIAAQAEAAIVDTLSGLDESELLFEDYDVPRPIAWTLAETTAERPRIELTDGRELEVSVRVVRRD